MISVQEKKKCLTLASGAQFWGVGGRWVGDWAVADFKYDDFTYQWQTKTAKRVWLTYLEFSKKRW